MRLHRAALFLSLLAASVLSGLLGPGAEAAVTWYVDAANASCSDAGPGTATAPLCTIGAGAKRTLAGDTVRVSPATYREQVKPPNSGTTGSPITYLAGAPGVRVLGTLDVSNPSDWTPTSTHAWSHPFAPPSAPTQVFKDGVRLAKATSATTTTTDSWFYDGLAKVLYVDVGGGNPGDGHVIEAGARTYGFQVAGLSDIVLDGFEVRGPNHSGVRVTGGSAVTIRNLTVSYGGSYGILLELGASSMTLERNDVSFAGSVGIRLQDVSVLTVSGNVSHENGSHGIGLQNADASQIVGNTLYANKRPDVRQAVGIDVNGGSTDNLVKANLAYSNDDSGIQVYNGSNRNQLVRNLCRNNGDHGIDVNGSTDVVLVSNTSHLNTNNGINLEGSAANGLLSDNISVDNALTSDKFNLRVDATSTAGFNSNYDLLWKSGVGDAVQYNGVRYATVQDFRAATGHEAFGIGADPLFQDPAAGDLHLRFGSPATDSADASAPGFSLSDFDGALPLDIPSIPDTGSGSPPFADRGAYEYQDAPAVAVLRVSPRAGHAPLTVRADASGSTDDVGIESYRFDFGDGTIVGPQPGPIAFHTYTQSGTFLAVVTVRDVAGHPSTDAQDVRVKKNKKGAIGVASAEAPGASAVPTAPRGGRVTPRPKTAQR